MVEASQSVGDPESFGSGKSKDSLPSVPYPDRPSGSPSGETPAAEPRRSARDKPKRVLPSGGTKMERFGAVFHNELIQTLSYARLYFKKHGSDILQEALVEYLDRRGYRVSDAVWEHIVSRGYSAPE